ncbi:MAG: preprotein translocase subunit SecE [Arsenophonus endosymbiont of Ceratovacuna japonica]
MSTNNNAQENRYIFDIVKWVLVVILLIVTIIGNYYFRKYNIILRVIMNIVITLLICSIALWTIKGKSILVFIREARIEMQKVIWPTYQETLQTTLIIAAVTFAMALILWGLDVILVHLISYITSLRF